MNQQSADVSEELTPMLLQLGKALFICQGFEGTLTFLLSIMSHEEAKGEDGAFTAAIDLYSEKTLGQLLKCLGNKLEIPPELQGHLETGWKRRNVVVHRFLHEQVLQLADPKGRLEAEHLLAQYTKEIKFADLAANKVLDMFLTKYGTSVDDLKRNADRQWEYMNPTASDNKH